MLCISANVVLLCKLHYGHKDMLLFRVLGVVRTLLRNHCRLCCTLLFVFEGIEFLWTWRECSFVVKCGNTLKSTRPSLWQTCKVLHPWVLFHETMVLYTKIYEKGSLSLLVCSQTIHKIIQTCTALYTERLLYIEKSRKGDRICHTSYISVNNHHWI